LWFSVIPLALTVNLLFPDRYHQAERLLYFAVFGSLPRGRGAHDAHAPWVRARMAGAAPPDRGATLPAATWARNYDWRDNLSLFQATVAASPYSAKAHYNLGVALQHAGQADQALLEFRRAMAIYPSAEVPTASAAHTASSVPRTPHCTGSATLESRLGPRQGSPADRDVLCAPRRVHGGRGRVSFRIGERPHQPPVARQPERGSVGAGRSLGAHSIYSMRWITCRRAMTKPGKSSPQHVVKSWRPLNDQAVRHRHQHHARSHSQQDPLLDPVLRRARGRISAIFGAASIGDQMKFVKDFSLMSISLFSVIIAIVLGVSMLHKELGKKTIFNILSKPVPRWQFIAGKFAGLFLTVTIVVVIMCSGLLPS
jgi:hypothetical protein